MGATVVGVTVSLGGDGMITSSPMSWHAATPTTTTTAEMANANPRENRRCSGASDISVVRRGSLRRHGLQCHAPCVLGLRAGCAAQRDDSVAIDDDLRRLLRNAKVCLHICVEHRHLPWVSLLGSIAIYRRDGLGRVYINGDEGDIILEVGVHILDGPQLGPA